MDNKELVTEKSQLKTRWLVLFFLCVAMVGSYYSYDNPAALKTQIEDKMGDPSDYETMFNLLYTVYSIPNIFLPFFGGYFVSKLGGRICIIVFAAFILIGQIIFAFGLSVDSFVIMLIGRTVFGFGGESLSVGQSALLADWFKGKELAMAFGLNLSIARLGSVINNIVSPAIGVDFALWFSAFVCGLSLLCCILLFPIDRAADEEINKNRRRMDLMLDLEEDGDLSKHSRSNSHSNSGMPPRSLSRDIYVPERERTISGISQVSVVEEGVSFRDVFKFSYLFWLLTISCLVVYGCVLPFNNVASGILQERDYFQENPNDCFLENPYQCQSSSNEPIPACPSSKWYQPPLPYNATIGGKVYDPLKTDDIDCTKHKWSHGCTKKYCDRKDDAEKQATTIMSIPYIISACISPFLGALVDRIGCRAYIATIAPILLIIVHSLLGYSDVNPIGPLVGQGLAYSAFAAVLWPSVPFAVSDELKGLGYGVVTSVQNAGLASFPLIVAAIYNKDEEYIPNVELFFVLCAALGTFVGIMMNVEDYKLGGPLNRADAHSPNSIDDGMKALFSDEEHHTLSKHLLEDPIEEDEE